MGMIVTMVKGVKIMNNNNRVLIFLLNLLLFLSVACVCYVFVYSKYAGIRSEKKMVYEKYYDINKQLDDFANMQMKMNDQIDSLSEPFFVYEDTFYSNEQNKTAYKVKILDLLKSLGVNVGSESLVQEQTKDGNISMKIKINTEYERLCKFLFEIEKYSIIDNISVDYKGNIVIQVSPILFDEQTSDFFSGKSSIDLIDDDVRKAGYFKEIADKIDEVKEIGEVNSWREFQPIPRNPFYYYVQPKKNTDTASVNKVSNAKQDKIKIDGIMYDKQNPMVIIDGKFYYIGGTYKNYKIVQINENNIKVNNSGKVYTIKIEN